MANELKIVLTTGLTVTATTYLNNVVVTSGIACPEVGTSGTYQGSMTGGAGLYDVLFYSAGSVVGAGTMAWDGSKEVIASIALTGQSSTALDLISGAMFDIGAREGGEPVDPNDANEAFTILNLMLDEWSNSSYLVVSISEIIQNIAGATDWTIGVGGQINVTRPLRINSAFVRVSNIDYPVSVLNVEQYEGIVLKQMNGPWPRALYYNSGSPQGIIKFWPLPSSGEIHLFVDQSFTAFATLNDTIQFPPGYKSAIRSNLALRLFPGFGKSSQVSISVLTDLAKKSIGAIKGTNMDPVQTARFDPMILVGKGADASFIMTGGF